MTGRHVLVTGGAGLVGRHAVASLLESRCAVTVLGRRATPDYLGSGVRYLACDLLTDDLKDILQGEPADTLLHLGWETRHGYFWQADDNLDWVAASLGLARAFRDAGGRRIVCAGTCVEYAAPPQGPCIARKTPLAPVHLYAVAKDATRRMLDAYCRLAGLSFAWGRIFLVTGVGEAPDRLVPGLIRKLLAGQPARASSGTQVRDIMDARDCGAAFAALAQSDFAGEINVSSGLPFTIGEIATTIAQRLGRLPLLQLGALPDRPDEPRNLWGEASDLDTSLGFRARYSLIDSIDEASRHWRNIEHSTLSRH